jgi:RNA polymerase sigma-70 factor (ECF subfamily)
MIAPADFAASPPATPVKTDGATRAATSRQEALRDAALVVRFNAGDETAFVEIVNHYRERLFAVAFAMLKNRGDAEEIAQDAFIRAHRGLAKFRGDASLATWLHRITLNLARNRYWYFFRRRRHATLSLDCACSADGHATFADLVAADSAGPVREAVAGEFTDLIATCMQRLGTRQREILTLRNTLNRTYGEIGRDLGISVGTVKSRIARARESLRVLLAESCPEFGPDAPPAGWFDPARTGGGMEVACA